MGKLIITKDNITVSQWDETLLDWVESDISKTNRELSWYLNHTIILNKDITFRQILLQLKPYKTQIENIFSNALNGIKYEELLNPIKNSKDLNNIELTRIYLIKSFEISKVDENYEFIQNMLNITGVKEHQKSDLETTYSLSSFSLSQILDIPIFIDHLVDYFDLSNNDIRFSGLMKWTLFEVLDILLLQASQIIKLEKEPNQSTNLSEPLTITELFTQILELDTVFLK
ncbi:MAG: hypothetical protein WC123_03670 [Bacilli bacterium]